MQNFLLLTDSTLSYAVLCSEGVIYSTLVLYLIGESSITVHTFQWKYIPSQIYAINLWAFLETHILFLQC